MILPPPPLDKGEAEPAPTIAFLRPVLGIGGSERLVLDAATALQRRGCRVRFFVPGRLDPLQFPEIADGTLAVEQVRTALPVNVGGRLRAPLAIGRTRAAARALARHLGGHDLIFSDVTSHVVPLVKRRTRRPVIFYCHFPDRLLIPEGSRRSVAYRIYRRPIDRMELNGLLAADRVIVNSAFTAMKLREAFPALQESTLTVVHPGVSVSPVAAPIQLDEKEIVLLSINRFDPRKDLGLAIEALAALRVRLPPPEFDRLRLVMAGRYQEGLPEHRAVLRHLRALAGRLELTNRVAFALSPSSEERDGLLARSRVVIYTPAGEHFGLVPLEAMAMGRPVVAANLGGPTETVVDGLTGFLCPPSAEAFADALSTLVSRADIAQAFGSAAREHVGRHFSLDVFGQELWNVVEPLVGGERR
jgi:alpha-1,3/alpha-1,6-mannosyltransferase